MLINITKFLNGNNTRRGLVKELLTNLNSSIRETDTIGWYRTNDIIGIIYTDIANKSIDTTRNVLSERIKEILYTHLKLNNINTIDSHSLSSVVYPEQSEACSNNSNIEPRLYPDIKYNKSRQRIVSIKRIIDVVGSIFALVIFSPIIVLTSVVLYISSDGPILFKQTRVGRFGTTFTLLKFRSMYADSDPSIHKKHIQNFINGVDVHDSCNEEKGLFKIIHDPRVTPIGRILRKTSLDELPQLLNVLRGNMSLVGPRPPIQYELDCYDIWHRMRILEMKPGITGLWQVNGRSRTTFDEMVRLDIRYVSNWSLWLDIKILLRTPWAMITCRGAY